MIGPLKVSCDILRMGHSYRITVTHARARTQWPTIEHRFITNSVITTGQLDVIKSKYRDDQVRHKDLDPAPKEATSDGNNGLKCHIMIITQVPKTHL